MSHCVEVFASAFWKSLRQHFAAFQLIHGFGDEPDVFECTETNCSLQVLFGKQTSACVITRHRSCHTFINRLYSLHLQTEQVGW